MEKMLKMSSARSFPVVRIGEQIVVGYNPEKYSEILGLKKGVMA